MQHTTRLTNAFAISTGSYRGFSLTESLPGIAATGCGNIELVALPGQAEHVSPTLSAVEIEKTAALCQGHGLNPIALKGPCRLLMESDLASLNAMIDLACRLGCSYLIPSPGPRQRNHTDIALIDILRKATSLCQARSLILAMEPCPAYSTGAQLATIVRAIDSPFIGIDYNTTKVARYSQRAMDRDILSCLPEIRLLHIQNLPGTNPDSTEPDQHAVLAHFARSGNPSPVIIEIDPEGDAPASRDLVDRAVAAAYAQLAAMAD